MRRIMTHWHRLLGYMVILAVAAGCFQQAGGAGIEAAPVSEMLPTNTPIPTSTPVPTETELPTATPSLTPTETVLGQGGANELGIFPTFTPVNLLAADATAEPLVVAQADEPADTALEDTNLPGFEQTATTEFLLQTQPLYVTATAFILGATQTVEVQLTGTAVQILPPTATPTATPGVESIDTGVSIAPGASCIHEVRDEDRNLYRISLRYGVNVRDIANASGITNINLISIGQKLTIPGCGTTGAVPPATSTPESSTLSTDPVASSALGTTTSVTGGQIHVVEQGETLFEISLRYGVPVSDIAAANGLTNINVIYLGQELVIP